MSISVLITLTAGTGGNTGPTFNLFSDADGYATAFETGVTKTNLVAGYTSSVVPDGSTIIRCKSVGTCTNYSDFTISGAPVPSPTPTPTPPASFTVELLAKALDTLSPNPAAKFLYRIGSGSWTTLSQTTVGTGYGIVGDILHVPAGSNVDIAVRNTSNSDVQFGNGNNTSFTGNCGEAIPYTIYNVLSSDVYYVNLNVQTNALVTC